MRSTRKSTRRTARPARSRRTACWSTSSTSSFRCGRSRRFVVVERPEEYGGDLTYESYDEVESDFVSGELHPADLKPSAASAISDVIDPVRERLADKDELLAEAYPEKYGAE